ncbi:MAG: nucleotidyltransferase family protein, partial [Bacteroidota bacterium]|nr:nucleotidyltransferase family protein [Bacteroidota bacterium]
KNNPLVSLAVSDRKSTNYLLFDSNNFLAGWKSYKTDKQIISRKCDSFRQYAFSGIHILSPEIFELFENKETFSIITPYLKLSKEKELLAFHHNHKNWFDAGSVEKLEKLKGINI